MICPNFGSRLDDHRGDPSTCRLCLQIPSSTPPTREGFVAEQDRIAIQIAETSYLIAMHLAPAAELDRESSTTLARRRQTARQLDFEMATYTSQSAEDIARSSAQRATLQAEVRRLEDHSKLYSAMDRVLSDLASLEQSQSHLEDRVEFLTVRSQQAEARLLRLEEEFLSILREFDAPVLEGEGLSASINRATCMPEVSGRRFEQLSHGMKTLVNIAYALAVHSVSLELDLGLPQLLMIDGLTDNIGHEGSDLDRVNSVYNYLIDFALRHGRQFQLIVTDHNPPPQATSYLRLVLTEADRLVQI